MLFAMLIVAVLVAAQSEPPQTAAEEEFIIQDAAAKDVTLPDFVSSSLAKRFDHFVYRRPGTDVADKVRFRLFRPTVLNPARQYPLLVWLHGVSESGNDNVAHLRWLDLVVEPGTAPTAMFILAVQCPQRAVGWNRDDPTLSIPADRITVTLEILYELQREFPIAVDRVYLSGVSSGGLGCWEMALREPNLFAAVAPLAGSGPLDDKLALIKDVPIWAFHNADDHRLSFDSVERAVRTLQRLGGSAELSKLNSVPGLDAHNCWTSAFKDYRLADWLLQQNLSKGDAPSPGAVPIAARWNMLKRDYIAAYWPLVWPRMLLLGIVTGGVLLLRREMRKGVRL